MSGSGRPGRLLKAPGNRRRRGMAVTRGASLASQNPAYRPADALQGGSAENRRAPTNFGDRASAVSRRALRAELLLSVAHRLALGASLCEPRPRESLAALPQAPPLVLTRRPDLPALLSA